MKIIRLQLRQAIAHINRNFLVSTLGVESITFYTNHSNFPILHSKEINSAENALFSSYCLDNRTHINLRLCSRPTGACHRPFILR